MNVWQLIEEKKFEEACIEAQRDYEMNENIFSLRNKVYALLNLAKYKEVLELCEFLMVENDHRSDHEYIISGISSYLLNDNLGSLEFFKNGEKCSYTDAGGGVEIQMYLYFLSIELEDSKLMERSIKKLVKLVGSSDSNSYPIPLAKYLIDDFDDSDLILNVDNVGVLRERQLCQAHFVKAIKKLESADLDDYDHELANAVSFDTKAYLEPSYYLAKGILVRKLSA